MPASQIATRLTVLISRFRRDRRGNIAVIFAFALLPVLSAIGCATDYSLASRMKAKMQSAADAAAVASISENSAGYIAATKMTSDGSVSVGVTDASNIFLGNVPAVGNGYTGNPLKTLPTVIKTGSNLTSVVTFTAQVPTVFMNVAGFSSLTISGSSSASSSLPLYLDFYLTLDVSGSMGLPSTPAEALRMQAISPDNWVQYRSGCTLACHFAPQKSACIDPPVTPPTAPAANPPTNSSYTQQYNTNNYCMGYVYSRLSQSALTNLLNSASTKAVPKQVPGLPDAMLAGLNTALDGSPNSLITGNTASLPYSLAAATSCPTDGTDACIQLRLDAVGYAVNQLFQTANADEKITGQFRIGLYPFIQSLYSTYFPLTTSINGDPTNSSTINYAAANLAQLLDTNMNSNLGSGGTHIDTALTSVNTLITSVGDGSAFNKTLPYVFLVTDGAQDPQTKGVPNGNWSGSNHATTLDNQGTTSPIPSCAALKNRGIIVSVLYIPYQKINPVNASFANDEDDYANNNIPYIPASLQSCASPGFFYTASTPGDITTALNNMFNHALTVAHITN
jgi:Flp pilus assembly protein TadG